MHNSSELQSANRGAAVGILMLQTRFPRIRGDIGCARTWRFPVLYRVVPGASANRVVRHRAEGLLDDFVAAGRKLLADGADGITTSCGFVSLFQRELSRALDAPVASSSLQQVPMIEALLPPDRRCGILTISADDLSTDHLRCANCRADTPIEGTQADGAFQRAILNDEDALDVEAARRENVEAALRLMQRHPELGAIVLECTNMAPYAADIRAAVGVPVFSIYSFIAWFQQGLAPRNFGE